MKLKLFFFILFVCSAASFPQKNNSLYQYSVINALSAGVYEGDLSVARLKNFGNFGLGTFNDLDGEMIVLNGKVFQIRTDGKPVAAKHEALLPFAAVTFFKCGKKIEMTSPLSLKDIMFKR